MALQLIKAHQVLDRAMDSALAGRRRLVTDEDRLAVLFALYEEMTK